MRKQMDRWERVAPPAPVTAPRVCRPIHIWSLPDRTGNLLRYTPLFRELPRETLLSELRDAPQFQKLLLRPLLEDTRGNLRVLLLGEDGYCTTQAAVYLASLSHSRENPPPDWEDDDWGGVDYCYLEEEPDGPDVPLSCSLAVISPEALDPALRQKKSQSPAAAAAGGG